MPRAPFKEHGAYDSAEAALISMQEAGQASYFLATIKLTNRDAVAALDINHLTS